MLQKIIGVVAYRGIPFKMASRPQSSAQKNIDETALRIVFPKLVEKLNAEDVIDELFGKGLLEREEYEGILDVCSKENSKLTVNRRVLMAIIRRPLGFAAKLAEILRKKDSYLADALEKGKWLCMHALWSVK